LERSVKVSKFTLDLKNVGGGIAVGKELEFLVKMGGGTTEVIKSQEFFTNIRETPQSCEIEL